MRSYMDHVDQKPRGLMKPAELMDALTARVMRSLAPRASVGHRRCKKCSREHAGRRCPTRPTSYGTRAHPDLVPLLEARVAEGPVPKKLQRDLGLAA